VATVLMVLIITDSELTDVQTPSLCHLHHSSYVRETCGIRMSSFSHSTMVQTLFAWLPGSCVYKAS
jgi:hypothetical protein